MKALHFSDLKLFAESPLHFIDHLAKGTTVTGAMRQGTAVHRLLLGGEMPPVFDGSRRGKAFEEFARAQTVERIGDIMTQSELDAATRIVDAVRDNPIVREYIDGAQHEVPLEWEDGGVLCATRGIDILHADCHGDLKTAQTVKPQWLLRECEKRLYHAQLAFYARGLEVLGMRHEGRPPFLLCVENVSPFDVVVVHLPPSMMADGHRCVSKWLEEYRVCRESNCWPGHSSAPIVWEPREVLFDMGDETEEDGEITE